MTSFGYLRYGDQNPNYQQRINALKDAGCDEVFTESFLKDQHTTPALDMLLDRICEGDKLVACDISSLSRELEVVAKTLTQLKSKKASLQFIRKASDIMSSKGEFTLNIKALTEKYAKELDAIDCSELEALS